MRIAIIGGTQDTRENNEDFALTPFLFSVVATKQEFKIYGIGISWGWWAIHFGVMFYAPKILGRFIWANSIVKKTKEFKDNQKL